MRRLLAMIAIALAAAIQAAAGPSERVYLSTDRGTYLAGERVWCSAFCLEASEGARLSDASSIAYFELHSSEGMALSGRIALCGGRGEGCFTLPETLPTGNYRLVAYTALTLGEKGVDFSSLSRTISVINPSSTRRVKDGVVISSHAPVPATLDEDTGPLTLETSKAGKSSVMDLRISNPSSSQASLCVSVYCDDSLEEPQSQDIAGFRKAVRPGYSDAVPEYDGEIIRAHVAGVDRSEIGSFAGRNAFISVPGDMGDVYCAEIQPDGTVEFYTDNIYGSKDMVCEIEGLPEDARGHIEIDSPFAGVSVGEIPPLTLRPSQADAILERKAASEISAAWDSDTLRERLPARYNRLFGNEVISYRLDDYTRFPLMREVITEFVQELRIRKDEDGNPDIEVRLQDNYDLMHFSSGRSLILLDGVPVFDRSKILDYDPLLVESVNIYPYVYNVGSRSFCGVVDFVTYKRNLSGMKFSDNVRVYSYDGAPVPTAYTCSTLGQSPDSYPDERQTAYWHPSVEVQPSDTRTLQCRLPSYAGTFRIVIEGLLDDGTPVRIVRKVKSE